MERREERRREGKRTEVKRREEKRREEERGEKDRDPNQRGCLCTEDTDPDRLSHRPVFEDERLSSAPQLIHNGQ